MKTEFTDVSETQKTITIEIPSDVVDAEINKVARDYSRQARLPGFRPGKVPATVVKQRFRDDDADKRPYLVRSLKLELRDRNKPRREW